MKNKLYLIGLTIIVLTFILSLNPYWLIFTVPVFLIGILILWLSKKRLKTKILWTILPIVFWYPLLQVFIFLTGIIGSATTQKLDFNFHNDFKGKAIIVQEIKCGQEIEILHGREQLNFPKNGILLYKGKIKSGYINHNYYWVKKSGEKIKLPTRANYMYFDSKKNKPNTSKVGVWLEGMGMSTGFLPKELRNYNYLELIVSSKDSLEKYHNFDYNKKIDSIKFNKMKECK